MFSIVETIEDGVKLCQAVPSNWLADGKLYWPNLSGVALTAAIKQQIPHEESWNTFKYREIFSDIGE